MFEGVWLRIGSGRISGCQPLSIALLSSLYALPAFPDAPLRDILARQGDGVPWAASFAIAPEQTASAVAGMLRTVMAATRDLEPGGVDTSALPEGSRARMHLGALVGLWASTPEAVSPEMRSIRAFLGCGPEDALQPLAVIWDRDAAGLSPLERCVLERLEAHHGIVGPSDPDYCRLIADRKLAAAPATTLLGHVQRNLLDPAAAPVEADDSLAVLSVRDSLTECEAAAAIIQHWLANDPGLRGGDIGMIIPDSGDHALYLEEVFALAGLAPSSLPGVARQRNVGAEAVLLFVQCRRRPAPAMALASLYASPVLGWPVQTGAHLATRVMDGDFNPRLANDITGKQRELFDLIRAPAPISAKQLAGQLRSFAQLLSRDESLLDAVREARGQIARLTAVLDSAPDGGEPDWERVIKEAAAYQDGTVSRGPHFLGGVEILRSTERPPKVFRKLVVLGFNDGEYPRPPAGNPFFLDSEIALIEDAVGLPLPSQAHQLRRALDLLTAQLGAASEQVVLLLSERSREGASLAPSSSLPLVARLMRGMDDPGKAVVSLDRAEGTIWDRLVRWTPRTDMKPAERPAVPEFFELGRNLLHLRTDAQGDPRPQSPSRLEKLLVSPLAWLLDELEAKHIPWQPEQLSVALRGSLAHEVFERLFVPGSPLPSDPEIDARVPDLLLDRIKTIAPFLQAAAWVVERRTLEAEIAKSAKHWALVLTALGGEVVGNEFWLSGDIFGHPVRGKADCLIRLPDGLPVIVDYKKSGTAGRRKRLEAQWDLQVDLYRKMSASVDERSSAEVLGIADCLAAWPRPPAVAYHLLNDGGVLINGADDLHSPHVEVIDGDIAGNALARIESRFSHLKDGLLESNTIEDEKFYKTKASLGVYAFSASPLVKAFLRDSAMPSDIMGSADDE
ncbi:PD-(D/E)XK nuclease family protein [Parapedomonas caeni]